MNTFIKRSMKLAVAIVFIGASVVPACAQRGKGFKNLPKALGKKPPLTGTAPVVKPVTPRIPPTLQSAAVPNFTASVNKALDNAVERVVAPKIIPTSTVVKSNSPVDVKKLDKLIRKFFYSSFAQIGPQYILFPSDPRTDIDQLSLRPGRKSEKTYHAVIAVLKEADERIFHRHKGKIYIDVLALGIECIDKETIISYKNQIISDHRYYKNDEKYYRDIAINEYSDFINKRNQQIMDALQNYIYRRKQQLSKIDPTTQRTAEEIKSLVENLDPENPLRQAIEGTLKDNGYIAPAE